MSSEIRGEVWENRLRRMRIAAENMSENERISIGLSNAGQRIFLDSLEAIDQGTAAFTKLPIIKRKTE